jgi:hypothetical protein
VQINNNGLFNFDAIPAASRTAPVTFTIYNCSSNYFKLTNIPMITSSNSSDFSVNQSVLAMTIPPNSSSSFSISFISGTADGLVKSSNILLKNNFGEDIAFTVNCTSKLSGLVEFKVPGTFNWNAPYNISYKLSVVGGGGNGGNDVYPYSGGGGGAGQVIVAPKASLLADEICNITVGSSAGMSLIQSNSIGTLYALNGNNGTHASSSYDSENYTYFGYNGTPGSGYPDGAGSTGGNNGTPYGRGGNANYSGGYGYVKIEWNEFIIP